MTPTILRTTPTGGKGPLARPYAKLPHDIAADHRLLPIDVRLLLALVFFARDRDTCWPSDNTLGGRIGRSRPTVQRRLRHLEALGLIVREKTDANPTGRLIRTLWRTRETPPVSPTAPAPRSPVRHELGTGEKDSSAPPSGGQRQGPPTPPRAMTAEQVKAHYAGWLANPENDPLRRLAERRLAEALKAASEPSKVVRPAAPPWQRPKRRGGYGGPRPPFAV